MTEARLCIHGCTARGEHYADCASYGVADGECRGCVRREARPNALICDRCYGRLRRNIDAIPDLIGQIRTRAYPIRAAVFDKVMVGGTLVDMTPAPVSVDLIDAGDTIMRRIREWTHWLRTGAMPMLEPRGLEPGEEAADAFTAAKAEAAALLAGLPRIIDDEQQLEALWMLIVPTVVPGEEDTPAEDRTWTVGRALAQWPLEERAWWAAQPCPYCGYRTIRVTPARTLRGHESYACQKCDWLRTDEDEDEDWPMLFSRRMGVAS